MKFRIIVHTANGSRYAGAFGEGTKDDYEASKELLEKALQYLTVPKKSGDGHWIFKKDALTKSVIELDVFDAEYERALDEYDEMGK